MAGDDFLDMLNEAEKQAVVDKDTSEDSSAFYARFDDGSTAVGKSDTEEAPIVSETPGETETPENTTIPENPEITPKTDSEPEVEAKDSEEEELLTLEEPEAGLFTVPATPSETPNKSAPANIPVDTLETPVDTLETDVSTTDTPNANTEDTVTPETAPKVDLETVGKILKIYDTYSKASVDDRRKTSVMLFGEDYSDNPAKFVYCSLSKPQTYPKSGVADLVRIINLSEGQQVFAIMELDAEGRENLATVIIPVFGTEIKADPSNPLEFAKEAIDVLGTFDDEHGENLRKLEKMVK